MYVFGLCFYPDSNDRVVFQSSILQQLKIVRLRYTHPSYTLKKLRRFQHALISTFQKLEIPSVLIIYTCVLILCTTALLIIRSGDVEKNPGPKNLLTTYEKMLQVTEKKINNLKIACVNFQNVSIKHQEFTTFVNELDHQTIVGITETWLDETHSDQNWVVDSEVFKVFRCDRDKVATKKKKGGGVLLLVPRSVNPKRRDDLNLFTVFESVWVEYNIGSAKQLINISYCPNKQYANTFLDELAKNIDNAIVENKPLTLIGDYNINYLNLDERQKLDNCLIPYGLDVTNQITPTRVTESSKTLLDYIISEPGTVHKYIVSDTPFKTDHLLSLIINNFEIKKTEAVLKIIRDTKNYNKSKFKDHMATCNWGNLYCAENIDDMFNSFEYNFENVLNLHAPTKNIFVRNNKVIKKNKPWITDEIKTLSCEKKKLLKEYKLLNTPASYNNYKQTRNKLNILLKKSYKDYNTQLFDSIRGEKKKWKFMNNIRQSKAPGTEIKLLKNCFGDKITDNKKMSNYLNYMFSILGNYTGPCKSPPTAAQNSEHKFSFRFITEGECLKELRQMNINKPSGPSSIPTWALKDADRSISKHLTYMINECIKNKVFPKSLKLANVIPLYKKKDETLAINYRPISLTNPLSKIIERLMVSQINEYLAKHSLLSATQFGFRKKFSTKDALLHATEQFRSEISSGKTVSLALLDLSKAFDSISHEILCVKLSDLGFSVEAIALIMNYLTDRKQKVIVNNTPSEWYEINQGVPQGTVLGPLLFLLYVNDMNNKIGQRCSIVQYADDTLLFVSGFDTESATQILAANIEKVTEYFQSHKLSINVGKTKFMILHGCKNKVKIENLNKVKLIINETTVTQVSEAKYLGVILDNKLSFQTQTKNVLKTMAMGIKTIYTIRNFVPIKTRLLLLHSLVLCHLCYPAVLLNGINFTLLDSLNKQVSWAIKACCFKRKYDSSHELKIRHKILTAEHLIEYLSLIFLWRLVNNHSEAFKMLNFPNFPLKFNERKHTFTMNIGAKDQKTDHIKKSFLNKTLTKWNALPDTIKTENSYRKFKSKIKEFQLNMFKNIPHDRVITRAWDGFILEQ